MSVVYYENPIPPKFILPTTPARETGEYLSCEDGDGGGVVSSAKA